VPPNYRQQQGKPLATSERRGLVALIGAVVVAGAALGIWTLAGDGSARPPGQAGGHCVSIVVASSTGGATARHCGLGARSWCAGMATASGAYASAAQAACLKAGM